MRYRQPELSKSCCASLPPEVAFSDRKLNKSAFLLQNLFSFLSFFFFFKAPLRADKTFEAIAVPLKILLHHVSDCGRVLKMSLNRKEEGSSFPCYFHPLFHLETLLSLLRASNQRMKGLKPSFSEHSPTWTAGYFKMRFSLRSERARH